MSEDLVPLRVRVALPPRPASPRPVPRSAPRRAHVLHNNGVGVCLVEMLDGVDASVMVSGDVTGPPVRRVDGAPGLEITPEVVSLERIGREVSRACGTNGSTLVTFDLGRTIGRLAGDVRRSRDGVAMSIGLLGCGWHNEVARRWDDSYYRARVRLGARDASLFPSWIPSRHRRRGRRNRRGSFIQLDVLGAALGCNVDSPIELAASLGIEWPDGAEHHPQDVLADEALALADLYRALVVELAEVAPGMRPLDVWSSGSIVTYALRQAGIQETVVSTASLPARVIGACAAAFQGGEATAELVGVCRC